MLSNDEKFRRGAAMKYAYDAERIATLEAALRKLIDAGSTMPRTTPTGGACCNVAEYKISHGSVWAFDTAMKAATTLVGK